MPAALDPTYAPVNEHTPAHGIVFAQDYAAMLNYFDKTNTAAGDWVPFFGKDVTAQLAVLVIEDIEAYKAALNSWFGYLNNLDHELQVNSLKSNLGFLYGTVATLAKQLDLFKESLPVEIALKGTLQNLIKSQLAPAFERLIAYYKGGVNRALVGTDVPSSPLLVLRTPVISSDSMLTSNFLSKDWSRGLDWSSYVSGVAKDESVYGSSGGVFKQINHCSTHNLFKSIFDQFLKVFARVISEATTALEDTLTKWDRHEPHYALFLTFLRLFEYVRSDINTLTERHLDFYYREILQLKEKGAEPNKVHLLVELAKQVSSHEFKTGELFKAGKDTSNKDVFFANDRDFVANQAKVAALKTLYKHGDELVGTDSTTVHTGRFYASPVANSDDGLGAALTSTDQSWHPFFNKIYTDGALSEIRMPEAEIGFAIASHYLLMAEGLRTITATFTFAGNGFNQAQDYADDIVCSLTTEKGWLTVDSSKIKFGAASQLTIELTGSDPAITPYSSKIHGYNFATDLPVLVIKLRHRGDAEYAYSIFKDIVVTKIDLTVSVEGLKTLAVSNDFGPVDTSKPFQPFGPSPVSGNALVIGSKELFQKKLSSASVSLSWLTTPQPYGTSPEVDIDFLDLGQWNTTTISSASINAAQFTLTSGSEAPVHDEADFSANELYSTGSRYGFSRLRLNAGFGQDNYQDALLKYLRKETASSPGKPPLGPMANHLSISYEASTTVVLNSSNPETFANRAGWFFHLTPFGTAERHPYLSAQKKVYLFPQFDFLRASTEAESEAEFYIGISGLVLPQNLALLFQVADGTANPLALKPTPHIDWSYLKNNEWISFAENEVQDETGEILNSGIITFAIPHEATLDNTLLPSGMVWIRAAVSEKSDAICSLKLVAAQALEATFADNNNSPDFPALPLAAGTISKLDQPDSAVKTITQPFAAFGGRGVERSSAFCTRISERLRHKDRAITLWDYERLILEAFPQVYKVKCLNHTRYEPGEGGGIYRELAPGHVTVIVIPNLKLQKERDPLKPYTDLGLLQKIVEFLKNRVSGFAKLHVMNPQFEEVRVSFKLRLYDGFDKTYYSNQLQQSITRFLSPWAFTVGGAPSFGGKIYKSVLINFVEEQLYVDYVTDFQLFHDINGVAGTTDLDEVEGSRAISILVSAPASKHKITTIEPALENVSGTACACEL